MCAPRREVRWSRPPLRPRRCRLDSTGACAEISGCTAVCSGSSAKGVTVSAAEGSACGAGAGSGTVAAGSTICGVGAGISAGSVAPRRVALSCAFVFQSARRNRSAAVKYHRPASAVFPLDSKKRASSNATIASRVFEKRLVSCPAGSFPERARRIRAVICFQSAIQ